MIEVKKLTKDFGKFRALDDINLKLNRGKSYALIGPNGCGKTTLIKSILGLNVVNNGDILVQEQSVKDHHLYREKIGYMPQIGRYPENMTILQTINMIKDIRRIPDHDLDLELYNKFEIKKLGHKKMGTLSGGTTQKVSSVLAFMFNPDIIILDEPTAGLDPLASEILKEKIIKEKEKGKLIIITSHLLSELDEIISEIIFMNDGKILLQQSVEQLKNQTHQSTISEAIVSLLKNMPHE